MMTIIDNDAGEVLIRGWMGDRSSWKPAIAYILTYKMEQQLSLPSVLRPDLAGISEDMIHSGFSKSFRFEGKEFDRDKFQIFVIFDDDTYAEMEIREGIQ